MVVVTEAVLRRQIAALPCPLYQVRLIHSDSRQAYPGLRQWTASQLCQPATVGFLRLRNREGYDVYFRPYAGQDNAGYLLLDLDCTAPGILARLRAQGHEPSVVVETSPGRWQAWVRVSPEPLSPALATRISRRLAQMYAADPASAEGRHLGRLAGFTNRKPQRRQSNGLAPWVKLILARGCLARNGAALLALAATEVAASVTTPVRRAESFSPTGPYRDWLNRLRILERYPCPDWSIADLWVARELLRTGTPLLEVATVLRGSPGFPRRHADPEDYLRRTLSRAAR